MKKLMIAAAIVCAAAFAQASSCTWECVGDDGWVWSYYKDASKGIDVDTFGEGSVGNYWVIALTANSTAGISVDNTGALVMDSKVGSVAKDGSGSFDVPHGQMASGTIEAYATDNNHYFALVIYDSENGLYGVSDTVMMTGVEDVPTPVPGDKMWFSNHAADDFYGDGDYSRWMVADTLATATPTPEPTSGLLLLLGVAGLALKRKRA